MDLVPGSQAGDGQSHATSDLANHVAIGQAPLRDKQFLISQLARAFTVKMRAPNCKPSVAITSLIVYHNSILEISLRIHKHIHAVYLVHTPW